MKTAFEKLTEIQNKVGYQKGDINPIALFGLFGEAGEVLEEATLKSDLNYPEHYKRKAVHYAKEIDDLKKEIRDRKIQCPVTVLLDPKKEANFDEEMSDVLYYLNALAINRGKTLEDYAEMSCQKTLKKTQQDISHGAKNGH